MAKFDFVDRSETHFHIVVEAGFKTPLERGGISEIMQLIVETERDPKLDGLRGWQGDLTHIEITKDKIALKLRYPTIESAEIPETMTGAEREDHSQASIRYLWYLFAKIDAKYELGDTAFPPTFRAYISLPDVMG